MFIDWPFPGREHIMHPHLIGNKSTYVPWLGKEHIRRPKLTLLHLFAHRRPKLTLLHLFAHRRRKLTLLHLFKTQFIQNTVHPQFIHNTVHLHKEHIMFLVCD